MSKKEFPDSGHCLSTNPIIVNYLKNNFERFLNSKYPKKAIGVAWNKERWWFVTNHSSTPEYNSHVIMNIITEINEMDSFLTTGTLSTSSGITSTNVICDTTTTNTTTTTTAPLYNPNGLLPNIIWIDGSDVSTTTVTNLVTEPIKLRIKCRNLKKNLKVSLMQINLK